MIRPYWWGDWPFSRVNEDISILDVVNSGTFDFKLAGLLWLLMEHRASVLVAAGPSFAGKTSVLHALLDFLLPGIRQLSLRGYDEDFKFPDSYKPHKTYLITEEISNHSYEYLWGYQVTKAFELLPKGYALGGTIHARNVKEVAYVLHGILNVPLPLIAGLSAVITLQVARRSSYYDEPVSRVDTVSTISLTKGGLVARILAARQLPDEEFFYPPEQDLHSALCHKFAIKYDSVSSEMERRGLFLSQLRDKGVSSREEVRKEILKYYQS
jgi:hypothetical protein